LKIVGKTGGQAKSQPMGNFSNDRWSGNDQLWWTGATPGARLELEIPVESDGTYDVDIVLTRARDYGIVRLTIGGQVLGGPVDLFNAPDVVTTGMLSFNAIPLKAGNQRLQIEVVGANPKAVKSYMVGFDFIRLLPAAQTATKTN